MERNDLLIGGAAVVALLFLIPSPSGKKNNDGTPKSVAQEAIDEVASGVGKGIGDTPVELLGGIADGFTGSAKEVGWGLAKGTLETVPDWILNIERGFFRMLPPLYPTNRQVNS